MGVLEAEGIDGSSLLGFLAAVGALRLLDEKHSGACLRFDRPCTVQCVPSRPTRTGRYGDHRTLVRG
jgi:hypothetical protein